jgi:hypothetical protein
MNISTPLRPPGSLRFEILFDYGGKNHFFGPTLTKAKRKNEEKAEGAEFLP